MEKVYISIVNHNNFEDTIECLESVLKSTYINFQIFVVDNSSNSESNIAFSKWARDNEYSSIITNFADLVYPLQTKPISHCFISSTDFNLSDVLYEHKVVFISSENFGFAAANNLVLNYITRNINSNALIWLLNNDTVIEKDTLTFLINNSKKKNDHKYIYGSKLMNYYQPEIIQAIIGKYDNWLGKHEHIGEGQQDAGQFNNYEPTRLNYIVGASIFLPKLFLDEVGLMCEDYFLYFEEMDWLLNGYKKGFQIDIVHSSIVYHKEGSSIVKDRHGKKDTSLAEYYSIINRLKFIKKWYPICLITVLPTVLLAVLKRLFAGKYHLFLKLLPGVFGVMISKNKNHTQP